MRETNVEKRWIRKEEDKRWMEERRWITKEEVGGDECEGRRRERVNMEERRWDK